MNTISVPDDLYQKASEIAKEQHMSVDDVFVSAFAEHLATWERLQQRAAPGNRERFKAVMDKVPDVEPDSFDKL